MYECTRMHNHNNEINVKIFICQIFSLKSLKDVEVDVLVSVF